MSERVVSCSFLQNNISTPLKYDTWYLKKKLWQIGIFSITLKPLKNKWDGMFAYMYLGKLRKSLNKEILSLITQKESCPWKLEGYFYYLIWKTFFNLKKNQFPFKKKTILNNIIKGNLQLISLKLKREVKVYFSIKHNYDVKSKRASSNNWHWGIPCFQFWLYPVIYVRGVWVRYILSWYKKKEPNLINDRDKSRLFYFKGLIQIYKWYTLAVLFGRSPNPNFF